jgi:fucose 4-O-acetylase-like acetyltransferase
MTEKARDLRLDVLKATAITLVVFGHVIRLVYGDATDAPWLLASAFSLLAILDVPLFVFVSGYLAKSGAGLPWLGRRALQLLVPYLAWQMLRWIVYYRSDLIGWLDTIIVWRNGAVSAWFLYALFLVSALYVLVGRSRPAMIALAAACVLVPPAVAPYFSLSYVMFLFPVFVAGRLAGERHFEPGPWVLPLAAVMSAVMWAGPGKNLLFAQPLWAAQIHGPTALAFAVPVLVSVLRTALALSLIGSAFYLARGAKRGAWLGALTLGIYCSHPFFAPAWTRGDGLGGVAIAFVLVMCASVGTTMLLGRWKWTSFLLLGSGKVPWRSTGAIVGDSGSPGAG